MNRTAHSPACARSRHPILALVAFNIGTAIYAYALDRSIIAAAFAIVLPGAVLVVLAQTFSTQVARSIHGVFPRAERPIGYWMHVAILWLMYLFVSLAPILARYFPPSPQLSASRSSTAMPNQAPQPFPSHHSTAAAHLT